MPCRAMLPAGLMASHRPALASYGGGGGGTSSWWAGEESGAAAPASSVLTSAAAACVAVRGYMFACVRPAANR